MRLAWLTDIHLNFLDDAERMLFLEAVAEQADAVAISGDIGESPNIIGYLTEMEKVLRKPIYFVLGNHDFYRGSIGNTRDEVAKLAEQSEFLVYMTATADFSGRLPSSMGYRAAEKRATSARPRRAKAMGRLLDLGVRHRGMITFPREPCSEEQAPS